MIQRCRDGHRIGESLLKSGEKKKTNKHKQLRRTVPEMGGGQIVHVFPFSLRKKGNTKKNKNSQEISGEGRESPGTVRDNPGTIPWKFCLCVFLFRHWVNEVGRGGGQTVSNQV